MLSFLRRRPVAELNVVMVCLGNICRSPTAEAVLRFKLARAGLDRRVGVASAGTHGERGSPPDARAVAAAAKRGYDLSAIRSRRFGKADFEHFDWVMAMDRENLDHLTELCPPELSGRLGLLLQHAPASTVHEVPDPYYGGAAGFERVLDLLEPACDGLLLTLQKQLAGHEQGNFPG